MKRRNQTILLAVVAAAIATQTHAATIVNDTWIDATRTDPAAPGYSENGTDGDLDGDIESVWYRSGTGSSTTMSSGHMVNAAGAGGSMSLTTYFSPDASSVTLNNVGDKLSLTWVFTPTGVTTTSTGNQDMRLAVVDSAARLAADGTPANAVYSGYGIFFNMRAGTLGNAASLRVMEWAVAGGANNLLSTAGAWVQDAATASVVGTTPGYTSGNTYTLLWSITKTASGADIYQSITDSGGTLDGDGVLDLSYSDATPQTLSFDTFALRPQTPELTATSFDTTLFRVELTAGVPEPTTAALMGLGLFGLFASHCRMRR
jgi:hypothetical protein